jgi:hypothetical protein
MFRAETAKRMRRKPTLLKSPRALREPMFSLKARGAMTASALAFRRLCR